VVALLQRNYTLRWTLFPSGLTSPGMWREQVTFKRPRHLWQSAEDRRTTGLDDDAGYYHDQLCFKGRIRSAYNTFAWQGLHSNISLGLKYVVFHSARRISPVESATASTATKKEDPHV
jgi:hypothetical protein